MPNDDLDQFPTPSDSAPMSAPPAEPTPIKPDITPPIEPTPTPENTFEETPDVLPAEPVYSAPAVPEVPPEPAPATIPTPKGGSSFGSLIAIVLLLISGVALAVTVFLFSQTKQLKKQLSEVTQTLEQQRTTITPTPTPTIIEFPTATPTPDSTESAVMILPTPTATISAALPTSLLQPLADATKALKVAINHLPNAQLIIIKTENATSPTLATTKYFFRQDLTTKKYFYVLISNTQEPEVVDQAIYVTPDNNIPSLNDVVLGNALGLELEEALKIANQACTSQLCSTAVVKAQYIKSGQNTIWQLTFNPADTSQAPLIIQLNSQTKETLYHSTGF
jgi:hypothetical protein